MAIGPDFIAKLLLALDELEDRWRRRKISPDKAIDFCLRCDQRLGLRPEFEALRQRVRVTLDAASALRDSSPAYIRRDISELERRWARMSNDNYRDDFEECAVLLARTQPDSPERARVLAVISSVLDEVRTAVAKDPAIRDYLGRWLDRAEWRRTAAQPLPAARPRSSFVNEKKKAARPAEPANRAVRGRTKRATNHRKSSAGRRPPDR